MIGFPMCRRLLEAGHELAVWNRSVGKAKPLNEAGATFAASPIATSASFIFICVTDAAAVEDAVFGAEGFATSPRNCSDSRRRHGRGC